MNLQDILEARALAPVVTHNVTAVDTDAWAVIQYIPGGGTSGSAATLAIATGGETWTFLVDSATPAGNDAIGTSGVIDCGSSTYDTMGEVADYVNGLRAWRMYLVGAIRADNSAHVLTKSATSCMGDNGLTIYADTSDCNCVSVGITGEKFVGTGLNDHYTDKDDEVENMLLYGAFTITGASPSLGQYLRAYAGEQGSAETSLFSAVSLTSATKYELGEANLSEPELIAPRGQRLVLRVYSGSDGTNTLSAPTIHVLSKSAVLSGSRIVDDDNY